MAQKQSISGQLQLLASTLLPLSTSASPTNTCSFPRHINSTAGQPSLAKLIVFPSIVHPLDSQMCFAQLGRQCEGIKITACSNSRAIFSQHPHHKLGNYNLEKLAKDPMLLHKSTTAEADSVGSSALQKPILANCGCLKTACLLR